MFKRFRKTAEDQKLRELQSLAPTINGLEPEMEQLDDDALRARTGEFRARRDRGEHLDDLLIEAFAVVREASRRVLDERHYDVQLVAGAALHFGWVAEMKTGEGKTLASTLPAYLHGLTGHGVHLVTANDYLAARDAAWMGQLHRWLGLDVGLLTTVSNARDRKRVIDSLRKQYAADIVYGTAKQFAYDYLWDNRARQRREQAQRGHYFAIVDEADALLVDDALVPHSLGDPVRDFADLYQRYAAIAEVLQRDVDYEVEESARQVAVTEAGVRKVEEILGLENFYEGSATRRVHQLQMALKAKELHQRDADYVVQDGKVRIVDSATGRLVDSRWAGGLHSAVEAKEGVEVGKERQTIAETTYQSYFRLYGRLAGMTGTAVGLSHDLYDTYGMRVVSLPTHRPMARVDQGMLIYRTEDTKFDAVAADVAERHRVGQPVLVGTRTVEKSEQLAERLDRRGIAHTVLNARQHAAEADVIAQAGRLNAVTVVTGMAGRGVDILLGGHPVALARNDLRERDLDPDDPAHAEELASLVERYEVETAGEREKVRDLGGLCVLGTERLGTRRSEEQLRGRAGRQGDPGESRFYASFVDPATLVHANTAKVAGKATDETGLFDSPLTVRTMERGIERAQVAKEHADAEARKEGRPYEEVKHEQRTIVYALRNEALETRETLEQLRLKWAEEADGAPADPVPEGFRSRIVDEYLPDLVSTLIEAHCGGPREGWDLDGLHQEVGELWSSSLDAQDRAEPRSTHALHQLLLSDALFHFEQREQRFSSWGMRAYEVQIMPLIDRHWAEHLYEMDHLREGVAWQNLGEPGSGNSPGVLFGAWQEAAYDRFSEMMRNIRHDLVRYVMTADVETRARGGNAPAQGG